MPMAKVHAGISQLELAKIKTKVVEIYMLRTLWIANACDDGPSYMLGAIDSQLIILDKT